MPMGKGTYGKTKGRPPKKSGMTSTKKNTPVSLATLQRKTTKKKK
tara:strand:- start:7732 stop:7866 length:135 start_codon:yes stop_codon:yes gene_type:complete